MGTLQTRFSQASNMLQTSSNASTLPLIQLVSSPDYSSTKITSPNSRNKFWFQSVLILSETSTALSSTKSFRVLTTKLTQTNSDFFSTRIDPGQLKFQFQLNSKLKLDQTSKCKRSEAKLHWFCSTHQLTRSKFDSRARAPLRMLRFELISCTNSSSFFAKIQ